MTTKTCTQCLQRLALQKYRTIKEGKTITRTLNGAVRCLNPDCASQRKGRSTFGRDRNAALGMDISGFSAAISPDGRPLGVYDPAYNPKLISMDSTYLAPPTGESPDPSRRWDT